MKKVILITVLVGVGAFLWWAFSPLLFDKEVNDELDPELVALLESESLPANPNPSEPNDPAASPILEGEGDAAADTSTPIDLPQTFAEGPFPIEDTRGHPATGEVRLIRSPEQVIVRYENYDGTNGPDLFVYLAKDLEASEFVNLGRAKGNMGNINYEVPDDVDIDEYQYVMTWCKAFGVLFDYAEIN